MAAFSCNVAIRSRKSIQWNSNYCHTSTLSCFNARGALVHKKKPPLEFLEVMVSGSGKMWRFTLQIYYHHDLLRDGQWDGRRVPVHCCDVSSRWPPLSVIAPTWWAFSPPSGLGNSFLCGNFCFFLVRGSTTHGFTSSIYHLLSIQLKDPQYACNRTHSREAKFSLPGLN
jgi:hypothetical protein